MLRIVEMAELLLDEVVAGRAPGLGRLTVDQYHSMADGGILREGEPVELIDGFLIRKDRGDSHSCGNGSVDRTDEDVAVIHGPRHALCLKRVARVFRPVENADRHLHPQLPVTLDDLTEPEPDLAVVKGAAEDYEHRHPTAADVFRLVEVSDSSLVYDQTTKLRIYASAKIPVYWIVNIPNRRVEVYIDPNPEAGEYRQCTIYDESQSVDLVIDGATLLRIAVDGLF